LFCNNIPLPREEESFLKDSFEMAYIAKDTYSRYSLHNTQTIVRAG
jgi:hypothetical protein